MENTYCFIFGKTPQLSLAEIMAVLGSGIKLLLVTEDAAIVSCPQPLAVAKLQDQLGGTIKIGLIFGTTTDLAEINWSKWWQPTAGRFQFGFSAYGLSRSEQVKVKNVGLRLKKTWVSQGSPCRLVVGKEAALSSVIVIKEKLLNPGADFLIISDPNKKCWWLGQTQACQKFAEYAEAEFGRPQIDSHRGMIPLKLAKIMINLTGQKPGALLDPFCGLGTIVTTAASLGWSKLAGSDLDAKAVSQAKINWQWFERKQQSGAVANFKVGLASELSRVWLGQKFNSIVTEPDLGPALKRILSDRELALIQQRLTKLYQSFLAEAGGILARGGVVAMIWPIWQSNVGWRVLSPGEIINPGEWRVVDLQQRNYQLQPSLFSGRGSFWYARPDQLVGREVWILQKNN